MNPIEEAEMQAILRERREMYEEIGQLHKLRVALPHLVQDIIREMPEEGIRAIRRGDDARDDR